jgi:hypothetical protein
MSRKKTLGITLITLAIVCSQVLLNGNTFIVSAAEPSKLKIYVGPASVPADKNVYDIILVQLQDSKNAPARALEDTTISLSSSLINIGTVDSSITIPKGSTQATAKFYSTYTPGTTTITAAASGYMTVQASVTTVGPMPSTLAVYGFPPILPADGGSYDALVVQLQDSSGSPAKAPVEAVQVTLSSSNNTIAAVAPSVTIEAGKTYAVANIVTTNNVAGSAVITAIASGYSSKQTTITTQRAATQANTLKVYLGPPKVPADGNSYQQVLVQLQNSSGNLAQLTDNVNITLSSSNKDVGTVDENTVIPSSKSYATVRFYSTYRSGTTTITAAATDYTTGSAFLTTVGPVPSKLAVYCLPSSLPADNQPYEAIQVQVQDSAGKPAKIPEGDIIVNLFSSEPEAGSVSSTLTIPFGETYATGTFFSTGTANSTTITAQTSGYEPGQSKMTTYFIDRFVLDVSVIADPATIYSGNQTTIRAHVTYNGTFPTLQANMIFTSDINGSNFSAITEEGNGYYTTLFTAPNAGINTVCTITANASKAGYNSTVGQVQITINPSSIPMCTLQLQVTEENGNPISNAYVAAQSQPSADQTISGYTNETGYLIFENLWEGNYTLQINKAGYDTKKETINCVAGQTLYRAIILSPQAQFLSLPVGIAIVAIVIAAVLVGVWLIRRTSSSARAIPVQPAETNEP